MKSYKLAAVLLSLGLTVAGTAHAASIDYIFTGTFDGTLGSTYYTNQAFSVTLTGDTTAVTSGGGEFNNIPSSTTFTIGSTSGSFGGNFNEVAINSPFNTIGFEQSNSVSGFAVEALSSSALTGYALDTAFPQTSGTLSTAPATYVTSAGNLVFSDIHSLSFEADVLPTPLPSSFGLFAIALGMMGLFGYIAKRKGGNFSI